MEILCYNIVNKHKQALFGAFYNLWQETTAKTVVECQPVASRKASEGDYIYPKILRSPVERGI